MSAFGSQPASPAVTPSGFGASSLSASRGAAVARIAALLVQRATPGLPRLVGVAGPTRAGKTALCIDLAARLKSTRTVETIAAESLLHSNSELAERSILDRKGQPESYNTLLASGLLQRARWGTVEVPGYSIANDDIEASLSRKIDRPDILLIDGFNCVTDHRNSLVNALDVLLYVDGASRPENSAPNHLLAARARADIIVKRSPGGFSIADQTGAE